MHVAQSLTRVLAALMCGQALLGLVFPEQYRDPEPIRSSWFGNDVITVVLAVPLLIVGSRRAVHGSTRGLLLWLGMIAYAVYNYAFYLFGAALNVFFPLYVVTLLASAVTLLVALGQVDIGAVGHSVRRATPMRTLGGALTLIGVGLAVVWVAMWALYVFADRPTPVHPEAFKIVAALDLALMVPALIAGGVLLWRRHPWGCLIAAIASIQGALYLLVLSVNSIVAIRRGLAIAPGELPIWGTLTLIMAIIALVLLANVEVETSR
jgi:hypothetical protein